MPERTSEGPVPEPMAADDIAELARRLRDADHLEPEARAELADLLHELAEALDQPEPSAQTEHLARSTAHLVRAWHGGAEHGRIGAARERLEDAVARAEAKLPVATGIVLRLIDTLSGLGI